MIRPIVSGLLAGLLITGCATVSDVSHSGHEYPEARSYAVSEDPGADVDAALVRAAESGKRMLLVMGANWCHDSRALAGWLETDRFAAMVEDNYELVLVNVGMPQSGDGHNIAIAQRFGLDDLPGTPNVLVVTADGKLVNLETATTWRNAASREEDAIYEELVMLANLVPSDAPSDQPSTALSDAGQPGE